MSAAKLSSMIAINHGRQEKGEPWQERFPSLGSGQAFDHALRTVKDYRETYVHLNPVRQGLVKRAEPVARTCRLGPRLFSCRDRQSQTRTPAIMFRSASGRTADLKTGGLRYD